MTHARKVFGLLSIKYMPSLLAITCSIKIYLNVMSHAQKDVWLYAVNWINVVFCALVLFATYNLGRCFGYCWKHRSLCRVAGVGYLYYSYFLLSGVPKQHVLHITYLYLITVIVLTLFYKEVK